MVFGIKEKIPQKRKTIYWENPFQISTLLATREMQITTTIRFHLTVVRMAIIRNSNDNKCWHGCDERQKLMDHCL